MSTDEIIDRLLANPTQAAIAFIGVAYVEFNDNEKELLDKVRWYLLTADLVMKQDETLTSVEKDEFVRLHVTYIKKINEGKIKIPLSDILSKVKTKYGN